MIKKWLEERGKPTGCQLLLFFSLWRSLLSLARALGQRFLPLNEGFLGGPGLGVWANFDGIHYLNIAQNGYANFEQTFFPLYPLLIRFLAPLFGGRLLLSALFISHLCFLIALYLFTRLLGLDFKRRPLVVWGGLLALVLFPTSFFFVSVYTESLFLMLVLGAFLTARKQKWWLAGALGGLASVTRLAGVFLFPALLVEWFWIKRGKKWLTVKNLKGLGIFLVPLGLVVYMIFLGRAFGDPLIFIHAQKAVGYRETGRMVLLPQVFWRYFKVFWTVSPQSFAFWVAVLEFGVAVLFLVLIVFSFSKLSLSYAIFMLLSVVVPTLTGTLNSLPRYVLTCFPGFILLGMVKDRKKLFVFRGISFLLLILLTALFTRGRFIS